MNTGDRAFRDRPRNLVLFVLFCAKGRPTLRQQYLQLWSIPNISNTLDKIMGLIPHPEPMSAYLA